MKRVLVVILLILSMCCFVGCGGKVELLEKSDISITKKMKEYTNSYNIDCDEYESWFKFTPEEFMLKFNEKIKEKGYEPLQILKNTDNDSYIKKYSLDGETWKISFKNRDKDKEGAGLVKEIELSLYSDSEKTSKLNGDFMYTIIDILNPGMSKEVCTQLNVFEEIKDMPDLRMLNCGNVWYSYSYSGKETPKFTIKSRYMVKDKETIKSVTKPE